MHLSVFFYIVMCRCRSQTTAVLNARQTHRTHSLATTATTQRTPPPCGTPAQAASRRWCRSTPTHRFRRDSSRPSWRRSGGWASDSTRGSPSGACCWSTRRGWRAWLEVIFPLKFAHLLYVRVCRPIWGGGDRCCWLWFSKTLSPNCR